MNNQSPLFVVAAGWVFAYMPFFLRIVVLSFFAINMSDAISQNRSATFGIAESRIVMQGSKGGYTLDNSGSDKSWLVQTWVENFNREKTDVISSQPLVLRVNQKSTFRVNLKKQGNLPDDRESVFWAVAHSIPEKEKNQPENRLNLAYRFKSLLIYRPEKLKEVEFDFKAISWKKTEGRGVEVFNNTPFSVSFVNVYINGETISFRDNIKFLRPYEKQILTARVNKGDKVKFGYKNDYGYVKTVSAVVM